MKMNDELWVSSLEFVKEKHANITKQKTQGVSSESYKYVEKLVESREWNGEKLILFIS